MEEQFKAFRTLEGKPYRLLPLPMAETAYDEEGNRLPATYANFLIMNQAVLRPASERPEGSRSTGTGFPRQKNCRNRLPCINSAARIIALCHHAVSGKCKT